MTKLRELIGAALRRRRIAQGRTLREVAFKAGISLTYLSEVERGRKEPSSEVLVAICDALGLDLSEVLFEVANAAAREEATARPAAAVGFLPPTRRLVPVPGTPRPAGHPTIGRPTAGRAAIGRPTASHPTAAQPPEPPITAPRAPHVHGLHLVHRSA